MFHRVLGGKYGKRLLHFVGVAVNSYLPLFHRLKKRRLRFSGCAVYFIYQDDVPENRSALKLKIGSLWIEYRGAYHVRRHQIRRKLYARIAGVNRPGNELSGKRFGYARHTLNQNVAIGKYAGNQQINTFLLAHNYLS